MEIIIFLSGMFEVLQILQGTATFCRRAGCEINCWLGMPYFWPGIPTGIFFTGANPTYYFLPGWKAAGHLALMYKIPRLTKQKDYSQEEWEMKGQNRLVICCMLAEQSSFKNHPVHSNVSSGGHLLTWINNRTWRRVYGGTRIQWTMNAKWRENAFSETRWNTLMDYIYAIWILLPVGSVDTIEEPTERGDSGMHPIR